MKQNGTPWLVAVLALLAVVFPLSRGGSTAEKSEAQAESGEKEATPNSPPSPTETTPSRWKGPLQPFQDFFTFTPSELAPQEAMRIVPRDPKTSAVEREYKIVQNAASVDQPATISSIVAANSKINPYRLEFLIALVPDPVDSGLALSFDQAIKAIQDAYSAAGYLPDRFWLPWKPAEKLLYRKLPGVLLFRKTSPKGQHLAAVFLVGETPKIGVQKVALHEAITMALQFMAALHEPPKIRILGPSFSGSVKSLQRVLSEFPRPDQIVSGSATAKDIPDILGKIFDRTVVPDDILQQQAFSFLRDRLGWNLDKVALLSESDTAYGQTTQDTTDDQTTQSTSQKNLQRLGTEQIQFPSGLSNIRNEWEKTGAPKSSPGPVEVPKTTLSLTLGENSQPVDLVPEFSPLSLRSKDLALANTLEAVSRAGIRYVGILATDPRDKLFLATRIREFAPDVVLFTFDNSLLYAHPQYTASMDGMLVLTSFPLFTESRRWQAMLGGPRRAKYRRQFASEFEQGVFQAAQKLIEPRRMQPAPRIWVAAVGNGSLWPIATLPIPKPGNHNRNLDNSLLPFVPDEGEIGFENLAGLADLQLICFALILIGLAAWLWRTAYPLLDISIRARHGHRMTLGLLGFGLCVLWVAGAILLVLGTIRVLDSRWPQAILSALLGFTYLLVMRIAERPSCESLRIALSHPLKTAFQKTIWPFCVLAVFITLPWTLGWLWMPGGAELFHLRARKFSSGLSPIVSFLFWAAAIYGWVLLEIKRRIVAARQFFAWPLRRPCEPPLVHCQTLARPLRQRLSEALPRSRTFWLVLTAVCGPPILLLMATIQPIAETKDYGRVFISLIAFGFVLSTLSFYRFMAVWLALQKILARISHTRLTQALQRISPQVNWNPMKSFGWRMPNFDLLILSAEKVKPFLLPDNSVDRCLEEAFEAERKGNLSDEIAARRNLDRIFSRACRMLADKESDPAVADFLAIRLVVYIRYVFSHLRHCLTAALVSGLLLTAAVRAYAFEPKQFFSLCLWIVMVPAIVLILWVFLEMDRNASLSAIAGTTAGRVTFNRTFFVNFLSYGLVPLLGVVVSQFPQVSRLFVGWLNPLLHIAGAG